MKITTEITIKATPQEIWAVLMDFENYPSWNPFITAISFQSNKQESLHVDIQGMKFKPAVLVNEPNQKFQWFGKLLFQGLFDGKHTFELIEISQQKTLFKHSEVFTGVLVPFFKKKLLTDTKEGFELMNEALNKELIKRKIYSNKPNE